ncbi:phage minor tail protein domain-containing protein, partial [Escherichia coli]|uniref:phage minor tail protein domain-containing protein n=1 Tax=Escherichia coli TaxID=562 RepID=UPI0034E1DC61
SLWHNHPQKTQSPSMNEAVMKIEQEVLTTWPADAIARAEDVVYNVKRDFSQETLYKKI